MLRAHSQVVRKLSCMLEGYIEHRLLQVCSYYGMIPVITSAVDCIVDTLCISREIMSTFSCTYYRVDYVPANDLQFLSDIGLGFISDNNCLYFICNSKRDIVGLVIQSACSYITTDTAYTDRCYMKQHNSFAFLANIPNVQLIQGVCFGAPIPDELLLRYSLDTVQTNRTLEYVQLTHYKNLHDNFIRDTEEDYGFEERD